MIQLAAQKLEKIAQAGLFQYVKLFQSYALSVFFIHVFKGIQGKTPFLFRLFVVARVSHIFIFLCHLTSFPRKKILQQHIGQQAQQRGRPCHCKIA